MHQSVRPSPVFWAIVGAAVLGGGLAYWVGDNVGPLAYAAVFTLVIAGWVVSLCLHEFGHAFTAWRFGDRDIALRGYLDMDPRRYVSPVWSILVPIAITAIGEMGLPGAACMCGHRRCRPGGARWSAWPVRQQPGAGRPAARSDRPVLRPAAPAAVAGVAFLGFLRITALLLNLLPIPGLDGYDALEPPLSPETRRASRS